MAGLQNCIPWPLYGWFSKGSTKLPGYAVQTVVKQNHGIPISHIALDMIIDKSVRQTPILIKDISYLIS